MTPVSSTFQENVQFRFLPSTRLDRIIFKSHSAYSKLFQTSTPLSTSNLLFPEYGRAVAIDLQEERCDVIHVQHCSQYVPVIRAFNPEAKIVLHLHAECFSQNRSALEPRLRYVDLVTTVSNYVTEKTRRDFPAIASRCETMYNGIDPNEFTREKDYVAANFRKEKRILYVGAVSPHRGLHILLDAFKIVLGRYPNVRLDIVGPHGSYALEETFDLNNGPLVRTVAPYYAKNRLSLLKAKLSIGPKEAGTYISALKRRLYPDIEGKIAFAGPIGVRCDLIRQYYDADIFAFPSICNDSFGLPVIEAMAAGVPVVASRSGGVVETVKNLRTGFVVEKNDPEELAAALLKLLQDDALRESMGRTARERVLGCFTWDRVAAATLDLYRSLCGVSSTDEVKVIEAAAINPKTVSSLRRLNSAPGRPSTHPAKLRAMRKRLPKRDQLLLRIGAAKKEARRAFGFVKIRLPQKDER